VSIRDTVELLHLIVGGDARPQYGSVAARPMDQERRGDPLPAADLMDWQPRTPLEYGLCKTVAWYAHNVVELSELPSSAC
jgi:UDP-glucose 4-epimerase